MYLDSVTSHLHFTIATDIHEILCLKERRVILPASFYESNVIEITRNRQVIQIYSSLVRSSDLKITNGQPEQQSAHDNDHWRSHNQLLSINGGYLHTDDTRFDRSMFVLKDLEGNIMRLRGEFEWPASRLRGLRGNFGWKSPKRRSKSHVTFANTKLLAMQIVNNSNIFKVFNSICCYYTVFLLLYLIFHVNNVIGFSFLYSTSANNDFSKNTLWIKNGPFHNHTSGSILHDLLRQS